MLIHDEFFRAFLKHSGCEWLAYCGMGMLLYDGGLCVNRTKEEVEFSQFHRGSLEI